MSRTRNKSWRYYKEIDEREELSSAVKKVECPYCGHMVVPNALNAHLKVCSQKEEE